MKRCTFLWLFMVVALTVGSLPVFAQGSVPAPPHAILVQGMALVPVRALAAGVGATVTWEDAAATVTLARDTTTLTLAAYTTAATSNGQPATLPVPPLLRSQQLYVPARAAATAFGATVALNSGTATDGVKTVAVGYQGQTTRFRLVEAGRMLTADFTGSGQAETAFVVSNIVGIDVYNSPELSDIVPLEVWVVRGTTTRWRITLAKGVSVSRFEAQELTGDRQAELLLNYLTRHSYMGPYPGSIYTVNVFRWDGGTFARVLALEYSRDHGHLYLERPSPSQAAQFILVDSNWRQNEDINHYIAELYAWNGSRFMLAKRSITRQPITSLTAARRLLRVP